MEWIDVVKAYVEIGVLGVIAVSFIVIVFKILKNEVNIGGSKTSTENIQNQQNNMLNDLRQQQSAVVQSLQEQNNAFMTSQMAAFEKIADMIVSSVNNHVPTQEETKKISKSSLEIDKVLNRLLNDFDADNAILMQYHNGGHNLNKNSFLRMSITNEQLKLGRNRLMPHFKEQFRSILIRWQDASNSQGIFRLDDMEFVKNQDVSFYQLLCEYNIKAVYGAEIFNDAGDHIGFIALTYCEKPDIDVELVFKELENQQSTIQALLNIKLD